MFMSCIHVVAAAMLLQSPAPKPAAPAASAKGPAAPADITVTLTYAGKGPVDAQHKLLAWLFTDPNVTSGSRPVATQSSARNGAGITFKDAPASPVYIFAVYDEKGGYDGISGPPPAGVPSGIYRKLPKGPPTPVKAGSPPVKFTLTDAERWNK